MFNSMLRDFEEDSLSDPFHAHREHMRQMMRSFSEPFGGPSMFGFMDDRPRGGDPALSSSSAQPLRNEHRDMSRSLLPFGSTDSSDIMRNPFNMLDGMMGNMRPRMDEMHKNTGNSSTDSDAHSFRSSSVMTYSKVGNEPPKVYQATSSTRCAPGGIQETRQAIKDSETGLHKMRIGHHIKDRGHVVEKKINKRTGENELSQDFQNMDESEATAFDDEWQQEVSKFHSLSPMSHPKEHRSRTAHQTALTGPEQANRDQKKSNTEGRKKNKGRDTPKK